ncbi:predicted protein [Chaetoceros tenuissimus]|uniref:Uncharacterized protein n=1 Tax=Chaetoceros tenuissimus TaxID=426638 RepID=A0AAD3CWW0_9STRA|nr:predicted protein [Chaetoceros tenuissimus]
MNEYNGDRNNDRTPDFVGSFKFKRIETHYILRILESFPLLVHYNPYPRNFAPVQVNRYRSSDSCGNFSVGSIGSGMDPNEYLTLQVGPKENGSFPCKMERPCWSLTYQALPANAENQLISLE